MFAAVCNGVNCKRLFMAFAGVLVFTFVSNFAIHQLWLKEAYQATAGAWRPDAEMQEHMCSMMFGQLLSALALTFIFTKGYEGKGWQEGVRFGILIGLFSAAHSFIQYAVTPIPVSLLWSWVAACMIQGIGAGVIASLIYRR
jgi:hypothetical protein